MNNHTIQTLTKKGMEVHYLTGGNVLVTDKKGNIIFNECTIPELERKARFIANI